MYLILVIIFTSMSAFAQMSTENVEAINASINSHPQIVSKHFKSIKSMQIKKDDSVYESIGDGMRTIGYTGVAALSWLTNGWVKNNFRESIIDVKLIDQAGKTISFSGCTLKEAKGEYTNVICAGNEFKKYTKNGEIYVSILPEEVDHNVNVSVHDDDRSTGKSVREPAAAAAAVGIKASQK